MKKFADFLEKSPLVRIWVRFNQSATIFALVVALGAFSVAYKKYNEDNVKADEDRITKAWDTVIRMSGKGSNGGQVNAIQILVKSSISLDKVNLRNTYLLGANLQGASLREADLSGADLTNANLMGANLDGAKLDGAILNRANLGGASMREASFVQTQLVFSTIDIAILESKNMANADITGVKFVMLDQEGHDEWDMFGDTIAEGLDADGGQNRINQACADVKQNRQQDSRLPVKLPTRKCAGSRHYNDIRTKGYDSGMEHGNQ